MRAISYAYRWARFCGMKYLEWSPKSKFGCIRALCASSYECPEARKVVEYLDNLKNYEKSGVPENAGTDSDDGFDLGRMRRLMDRLGNPQSKYKVVHVAGTKGKGSTAAFLSNILRAEGYSVGCYTSPHIQTICERMTVGTQDRPISTEKLSYTFQRIKKFLDQAVAHERGHLSHFEVLTAIAFTLFGDQKVDIAVIEAGLGGARDATNIISSSELAAAIITTIGKVILGGPFPPHIEQIIRDRALSMCSPVVSASGSGNRSCINGFGRVNEEPHPYCDILLQIKKDIPLFIELHQVNLSILGYHQLQNAVTATCAALSLQYQGWKISDASIRSALESTRLLGRTQFLKKKEINALGLCGSMTLLDGAHTQESAKALAITISTLCQGSKVVLVVAMASDKDHFGFARELLTGLPIEAVIFTEVKIAGDNSRTASALFLRDIWAKACSQLGVQFSQEDFVCNDKSFDSSNSGKMILATGSPLLSCLRAGHKILQVRTGNDSGIIVVCGSLHIVSSVLASIDD